MRGRKDMCFVGYVGGAGRSSPSLKNPSVGSPTR